MYQSATAASQNASQAGSGSPSPTDTVATKETPLPGAPIFSTPRVGDAGIGLQDPGKFAPLRVSESKLLIHQGGLEFLLRGRDCSMQGPCKSLVDSLTYGCNTAADTPTSVGGGVSNTQTQSSSSSQSGTGLSHGKIAGIVIVSAQIYQF